MPFINHSKSFIFIANARCGSTSMYSYLKDASLGESYLWPEGISAKPDMYHMGIEKTLDTYPECKHYYKFAFVRNPWSRMLSSWKEFRNNGHSEWNCDISSYKDFNDFCANFHKSQLANDIHFIPVLDQLCIDGKISVDYVGKFENIEKDFNKVVSKFYSPKEHRLKILRQTLETSYREVYTKQSIDVVHEYYKKDIDFFGYKFDV
jgi:hypothetical protein